MDNNKFSKRYATELMNSLHEQTQDGTFCNVKIVIGDEHIFAHKEVLMACSLYFRTMFCSGFMEGEVSQRTTLNMTEDFPDIDTANLVISSMYTSTIELNPEIVGDVFSVCSFLLFEDLTRQCEEFMLSELSPLNCVEYWALTSSSEMFTNLNTKALDITLSRFHDCLIYDDNFLDLHHGVFLDLLKKKLMQFCSPRQILTLLIKKLVHSGPNELSITHFQEHLAEVELPLMTVSHSTLEAIHLTLESFDKPTIDMICSELTSICIRKVASEDDSRREWDHPSGICTSEVSEVAGIIDDNWSLDVLQHHPPLEPTVNAIIVVTSPVNGILGIYAYIPDCEFWVDFGLVECPSSGLLDVSQNTVLPVYGKLYFISSEQICILHLRSLTWERLDVEDIIGSAVEQLCPVIVNDELFMSVSVSDATVYLGKLCCDGTWVELQDCPEGRLPRGSSQLRALADGGRVTVFLDESCEKILVFDLENNQVQSSRITDNLQYALDYPINESYANMERTRFHWMRFSSVEHKFAPLLITDDGRIFLFDEINHRIVMRVKVDEGYDLDAKEMASTLPEGYDFPGEPSIVVCMGSSFWVMSTPEQPNFETRLDEYDTTSGLERKQQCPPPFNRILTATSGALSKDTFSMSKLARFRKIDFVDVATRRPPKLHGKGDRDLPYLDYFSDFSD